MKLIRSLLIGMGLWSLCAGEAAAQGVGFRSAEYTVGADPRAVAVGDFNGDGKLDLAVANSTDNTVSILLGNGDGTFGAKTDFGTGNRPVGIVAEDFNGDGKLDLATVNTADSKVSILLGNGDETFGAKTDFATGTDPAGIAVRDFNGDGKPDLVTANLTGNDISILLGHGGGVFGPNVNYATSTGPSRVVVGDFNGDGKLDVAALAGGSAFVSLLLGNGDGTFGPKTDFATGSGPVSLARSDFNADAKLDLVTANFSDSTASILSGKGDGTFDPKTDLGTDTEPIAVTAADFNADGKGDFLTANNGSYYGGGCGYSYCYPGFSSPTVSLRLGNGDGTFGQLFNFPGTPPAAMATGDFNADGRVDVAIANAAGNAVSILLQSAAVSPNTFLLSFGTQVIGSSSPPQTVTLNSTGSFPAAISSVTLARTDAGEFSISADTCSGNSIPSGSNCTMSAVFAPTAVGDKSASLVITHNAPGSPLTVLLAGTGLASVPFPVFSPSSVNFGGVPVGQSNVFGITLTNFSTVALNITSITLMGADAGEFLLINHCGASLGANASCQIDVTFKPASAGAKSAAVSVATDAAGSPHSVPLTGTGIIVPPAVLLSATSVIFNPQLVNTTSAAQTVTLTNTGGATLTITSVTLGGANAADFTRSDNCGSSVNGGADCVITLTFRPTATGSRTASFSISSNASGNPHTVALSGEGTDFTVGAAPGSPTTATVNPGGSANFTLSFGSVNGFAGTVGLSCSTSSPEVSCALPASVVVPNNVTVSVTTTLRASAPFLGTPPEQAAFGVQRSLLTWIAALLLLGTIFRSRRARSGETRLRLRTATTLASLFLFALLWSGCGGGSASAPAPRTDTVTVSASSSGVVHTMDLTVVVR